MPSKPQNKRGTPQRPPTEPARKTKRPVAAQPAPVPPPGPEDALAASVQKAIDASLALARVFRVEIESEAPAAPEVLSRWKDRETSAVADCDSLESKALLTSLQKADPLHFTPQFRELLADFLHHEQQAIRARDRLMKILGEAPAPKATFPPEVISDIKEVVTVWLAQCDFLASKAILASVRKAEFLFWSREFRELLAEFLHHKMLCGDARFFRLLAGEVGRATHAVLAKQGKRALKDAENSLPPGDMAAPSPVSTRPSEALRTKPGLVSSPLRTSMLSGIAQVLAECGPGVEDNPLQDKEIAELLHVEPEVIRQLRSRGRLRGKAGRFAKG